ncbi:MAG: glycosyltransferase, partial [Bacilli bacterium]
HFLIGDIFVCSSQWQEPLARVHYEAMGAGLPIITTHRGGNAEVIKTGENGIVIEDYSNPQAWAATISYLLSNPA